MIDKLIFMSAPRIEIILFLRSIFISHEQIFVHAPLRLWWYSFSNLAFSYTTRHKESYIDEYACIAIKVGINVIGDASLLLC